MGAFTSSDWKAIQWYAEERGWKIRDMMVYPMVRYRTSENKVEDVNLQHIKVKYQARTRSKKKVEA